MIYKGTTFTERINMKPMDHMEFKSWIEFRKEARTQKMEIFLCEDRGNERSVWSWWIDLSDPMTYEQIKYNVMEQMWACDTIQDMADELESLFEDGFESVVLKE